LLTGLAFSDELLDCVEAGAKAEADAKVRAKGSNRTMFTVFEEEEEEKYKSQFDKDSYRKMFRWVVGSLNVRTWSLAPHTSYVLMDSEISRGGNKTQNKAISNWSNTATLIDNRF
jgi:hypothetical protein